MIRDRQPRRHRQKGDHGSGEAYNAAAHSSLSITPKAKMFKRFVKRLDQNLRTGAACFRDRDYFFGFGVRFGGGLPGVSQQGSFSILPLALHL